MDYLDTKSILSVDGAKSITSHNSGGAPSQSNQQQNVYTNSKDNVKVVIRVRPLNEREKGNGGSKRCVTVENKNTIIIEQKPDQKVFNFDFVGDEDLEQEVVFNQIAKPIADCCLEGYNGTIFAYGQTGAGKTFTIQGPSVSVNGEEQMLAINSKEVGDYHLVGLMPRSFDYIFECIEKAKSKTELANDGSNFEYLIRCSYLEIYNEQIMDLLDPSSINLHIREDLKKGVYVEGLIEENVTNSKEMVELIARGSRNRHVGSTSMNKESSRSHSVLTTIIETKSMKEGGGVWNIKTSRFHIIDLAGSERQKYTGAFGERLKEAGMINKSLSALGNVINSLVDISEGKNRHVHYRDSKLTFLLRDSLGGNSKTVIIANISPSGLNYGETMSTLKFAQRAKLIKNKAVINEDSNGTINLMRNEINRLKKDLAESEKRAQSLGQQCAFCRNNIGGGGSDQNPCQFDEDEDLLSESFHIQPGTEDYNEMSKLGVPNGGAAGLETSVLLSGPQSDFVRQKFKNQKQDIFKMRERVIYLEGLLSANLDNLTSQQKFNEAEIAKLQQQNKKLSQAVESYEKQCSRDKMIIKFREDRITKLEQQASQSAAQIAQTADFDKQKLIADMKKEILVWKEAADHNAQAAKLFAEKAELITKLESMKAELKQTPDSLSAQMRSLTELNEGLNDYLKQYCEESKKSVENELLKTKQEYDEKLDKLTQSLDKYKKGQEKFEEEEKAWNEVLITNKGEIEKMKQDFVKEREDLERINKEVVEQIKNEIYQISENKTEQEREAQLFKIQLIESQQQLEKETMRHSEVVQDSLVRETQMKQQIDKLENIIKTNDESIKELTQQSIVQLEQAQLKLDNERKQFGQSLHEQSEIFEKKLFELEKQVMDDQNERDIIMEEGEQLNQRIKTLEQDNDRVQNIIVYKDEEIKEYKELIQLKTGQIQSLNEQIQEIQVNMNANDQNQQKQIDELIIVRDLFIKEQEELKINVEQLKTDKVMLEQGLKEINEELLAMTEQKDQLFEQLENNKFKMNELITKYAEEKDQYEGQISLNLKQVQGLENEVNTYKEQIALLQQEVKELNSDFQNQKTTLSSDQQVLHEKKQELQVKNENLSIQVQNLQEELKVKEQGQIQSKASLEELNDQLQEVKQKEKLQTQLANVLSEEKDTLLLAIENLSSKIDLLSQDQEQSKEDKLNFQNKINILTEEKQVLKEENENLMERQKSLCEDQSSVILKKEQLIQQKEQLCTEQQNQIQHQEAFITGLKEKLQQQEQDAEKQQITITQELSQKIVQVEQQYKSEIVVLQEQHTKITKDNQKSLEIKLQEQVQQNQTLVEQNKVQLQEIISTHKEEITQVQTQHQVIISEIQLQHEQKQDVIIQEKEKIVEELKLQFTQQVTTQESQLEQQLQTQHQQQLKQVQSSYEKDVLELKDQIQQLQDKVQETEQIFQVQLEEREQQHRESLIVFEKEQQIIIIQKVEEVTQVKNKEIEVVQQQQVQSVQLVQDNSQTQIKQLEQQLQVKEEQIQVIKQEKVQEVQQSQQVAQDQKQEYDTKIQILQQQIDQWMNHKKSLDDKLYQLSQSYENQLLAKDSTIGQYQQQLQQFQSNQLQSQAQYENQVTQLGEKSEKLRADWQQKELIMGELINNQGQELTLLREHMNKIENEKQQIFAEVLQLQESESQQKDKVQETQNKVVTLEKELDMQSKLLDNTLEQLNNEHIRKYQEIEKEYSQVIFGVKAEQDQYKQHCKELSGQVQKLKEKNDEQREMLKNSKETISGMVSKENDLMIELEKKINELKEHQEGWRKRAHEVREEKDQMKKEWERTKKENENLRELIKLKDRQIEEQLNVDEKDRETIDKIQKENKDLRNQLIKRDFEMKEVVKTIKLFQDEKNRLEKELDKLHRENDQLIGHKNPSQKIQHHLKIKEENNKLREENFKLQEELRRKTEILGNRGSINKTPNGGKEPGSIVTNDDDIANFNRDDLKKLKKENLTYQETINRLVDHILSQPGLMKVLGLSEETHEKIQQSSGTSKVKNAMELISLFSNVLSNKERDIKEITREKKKIECRLDIVEKEKNLCKQQLELVQQHPSSGSNSFIQPGSYLTKSPNTSYNRLMDPQSYQDSQQQQQQQQQHLMVPNQSQYETNQSHYSNNNNGHSSLASNNSQLRLQVDGFLGSDKSNGEMNSGNNLGYSKKSPSPLYNFKQQQQKEKENVQSKRDLFNSQQQQQQQMAQRSGSGRRAAYLSNVQQK